MSIEVERLLRQLERHGLDVVNVGRCKNCLHWYSRTVTRGRKVITEPQCSVHKRVMDSDDYCSKFEQGRGLSECQKDCQHSFIPHSWSNKNHPRSCNFHNVTPGHSNFEGRVWEMVSCNAYEKFGV